MMIRDLAFVTSLMEGKEKESGPEKSTQKNNGKLLKTSQLLKFGQRYTSIDLRN